MNYLIATMKQIHSEINFEISFGKSGNKYTVACIWGKIGESFCKIETLDFDEAVKRYNKLSNAIISGCGNLEYRLKILRGEI